ncbi:VTT domain-containing protein, partial [Candidatus Woesearchaeota archaeon]|nr:VTT domain-containing protein [Candidatus Woesearchaeota archaeon]
MILDVVIDVLVNLSYLAIVIAIFAGSFGVPIPEEIVLLIIGYLAKIEFYDIKTAMLVAFVSMIAADNFSYLLGYRGSKLVAWVLKTTKMSWLVNHLERHPCKTIFLSRFLSGARVFFPIAA